MRTPVAVGVVGLGRWGLALSHAFEDAPLADLRWVCDERPASAARARPRSAPSFTRDVGDLLEDETLDAIAVATPTSTRCALVRRALEADKHVYVSGPLGDRARDTVELMRLAASKNRRLMIGHALLFHPGIRALKKLIDLGRLGEVYYLTATVTGSRQSTDEVSVVAAEAGSAIAAILHLLGDEPIGSSSMADSYISPGRPEVAACHLRFATGIVATLEVSWLDAREQCRIAAVGSRRTAVFDAFEPERKVTVYEQSSPRGAEIVCPRVALDEPVRLECEAFLTGIRAGGEYRSTRLAPAVVRVLESFAAVKPEPVVPLRAAPARLRLAVPEPGESEGASLSTNRR